MRSLLRALPLASLLLVSAFAADEKTSAPSSTLTRENKPWTRWWWPGSGVDKASITQQLEQFAAAGLGGVEITPIYGAKGYESRYIDFLSPKWMEMLEHTGREAKRLGLGVDMATGTGWPFGGPWIDEAHGSQKITLADGKLTGTPTKMKVKRAAPGDEGLVIDPFSTESLQRYLAPFDKAFANFPAGLVRSQFHDSFEYYEAGWTPTLPKVFQEMHGYDIQQYAEEIMGKKPMDADTLGRIKSDYREVLAKLHLDYLHTWVEWSHRHGFLVRNQSHGAPGNLLDLYANADIAETEVFGSTPFPIPGLRRNPDEVRTGGEQDLPEGLVIRMASSASHIAGHPYASSETCTWLRDHWHVAPSYTKPEIDRLFVNGINHIFYHGTVFSPTDATWPGWFFYAATQFNPNNTWWDDFGALNGYVARVQSVLQAGKPDNDILLYWPFADVIDDSAGTMKMFAVHNVKWLLDQPVGKLAAQLTDKGFSFDYISDAQLAETTAKDGNLVTKGGTYKILIVPTTRRMPVETLKQILAFARGKARVLFTALPEDVPGYGRLEARRIEFKQLLADVHTLSTDKRYATYVGALNLDDATGKYAQLTGLGISREPIADAGLGMIRRATDDGYGYFVTNLTAKPFAGWTTLGRKARAVLISDPLTGRQGIAATNVTNDATQVYLQLKPGESLLLETYKSGVSSNIPFWDSLVPAGAPVALTGNWHVEFIKGGPELPPAFDTAELKSWTELGGMSAQRFGGTARYTLNFDAPTDEARDWLLDLGDVREVARLKLNGKSVTTVWSLPFQVRIGQFVKPGKNTLELEVTNLAANRIRDLDQRKVDWKIMREINIVNINYKPFDASTWPIAPSGLLGPITLTPLKTPTL